jgi:hypothetical protein
LRRAFAASAPAAIVATLAAAAHARARRRRRSRTGPGTTTVAAPLGRAPRDTSSATARSSAVANRSSGRLARQRAITASSAGGTEGARSAHAGRLRLDVLPHDVVPVVAGKGRTPVAARKSVTPSA